jgi:hypothetical protein
MEKKRSDWPYSVALKALAFFAALATTAVARGTVKQAMFLLLVRVADRIAYQRRKSQPSRRD